MSHAMDEDAPRVSDDERSEDEDRRPGGNRNVEKSKSRSRSRSREREPEKVRRFRRQTRWRDAHPIGVRARDVDASRVVARSRSPAAARDAPGCAIDGETPNLTRTEARPFGRWNLRTFLPAGPVLPPIEADVCFRSFRVRRGDPAGQTTALRTDPRTP